MSFQFASTLYRTEKAMVIGMIAEWTSAGGSNSAAEVAEYLEDWTGNIAEMRKGWEITEEQEEAIVYYAEEGRIGPADIMLALYGEPGKDFSDYVKAIMADKGITQVALAETMGITQATVSGMVNRDNPTLDTMRRLADALGVTVSDLIGE